MVTTMFDWVINLPKMFAQFGNWLISPLPYINIAPLALFGVGGLTLIITMLCLRLFIGG